MHRLGGTETSKASLLRRSFQRLKSGYLAYSSPSSCHRQISNDRKCLLWLIALERVIAADAWTRCAAPAAALAARTWRFENASG